MSDRVLVEEVARLVGCEPPHLIEKYRGRIDHESDCGRRAMMLWSDARKECDEAEVRGREQNAESQWWLNYPSQRDAQRHASGLAAMAAVPRIFQGPEFTAHQREAYRAAMAKFDREHPFPGSGEPGAARDAHDAWERHKAGAL